MSTSTLVRPTEMNTETTPIVHCYCTRCQWPIGIGSLAMCGHVKATPTRAPIDAEHCVVCDDLWLGPCPRCGKVPQP